MRFPVAVPRSVTLSPALLLAGGDAAETLRQGQELARARGPAYTAKDGSVAAADVLALGSALGRSRRNLLAALDEAFLDTATYLLPEWEAQLGLPVSGGLPPATRRSRLVAKWRAQRGGTPQAIARAVSALLTAPDVATVYENTAAAVTDPAWVFVFAVRAPLAYFTDPTFVGRVRATVEPMKPAYTTLRVTNRVNFRCDDPDSLTDLTLLGT